MLINLTVSHDIKLFNYPLSSFQMHVSTSLLFRIIKQTHLTSHGRWLPKLATEAEANIKADRGEAIEHGPNQHYKKKKKLHVKSVKKEFAYWLLN